MNTPSQPQLSVSTRVARVAVGVLLSCPAGALSGDEHSGLTVSALLDFGAVPLGFTAFHTLDVTNLSGAPLTLLSATTTNAGFALLSTNLPLALEPAAEIELLSRFNPPLSGSRTGLLAIATSHPVQTNAVLELIGSDFSVFAGRTPSIQVEPFTLSFLPVRNREHIKRGLAVRNAGTTTLPT